MEQNKTFLKLLHQSELEKEAEDIIAAIRLSAKGKRTLSPTEWKQFYSAVDKLHPTLHENMIQKFGQLTEQQIKVYYLWSIGISRSHIANITNISRTTVWRWVKVFDQTQQQQTSSKQVNDHPKGK